MADAPALNDSEVAPIPKGEFTHLAATRQSGLINVSLSDTTVQVPIAIAANICNVDVNALASQIDLGDTTCDTTATSDATTVTAPDMDGGRTNQNGLVNIASDNLTIQLPIAVAANVCDVAVNVLAQAFNPALLHAPPMLGQVGSYSQPRNRCSDQQRQGPGEIRGLSPSPGEARASTPPDPSASRSSDTTRS